MYTIEFIKNTKVMLQNLFIPKDLLTEEPIYSSRSDFNVKFYAPLD